MPANNAGMAHGVKYLPGAMPTLAWACGHYQVA